MGKIDKIHKLLINRELSVLELCKHYLKYIEKYNPVINGYITVCEEQVIKKATEIDEKLKHGEELRATDAIPFSLKDNISTKDIPTTCASMMLSQYIPIYNSTVADKLENALLMGKTNMDEFAMGSTNETSFYGSVSNPYDLSDIPGGSSGGSAASVSADMCVFSIGSDTGGSVRLPSALCGCIGFKPTYGAISRYGLISFASSFDTLGIMSQNIEDCIEIFDTVSGMDKYDMTSVNPDKNTVSFVSKAAILNFPNTKLNDDNRTALNTVSNILINNQVHVGEVTSEFLQYASAVYYIISSAQASSNLARYDGLRYGYRTNDYNSFDEMVFKSRTEGFGKEVKRRILLGNFVLESGYYDKYYSKACSIMQKIRDDINKCLSEYDVLIYPVSTDSSYKKGYFNNKITGMYDSDIYNVCANLCEMPSVAVPCYVNALNRPVSLQFMSKKFSDRALLSFAKQLEAELNIKTKPVIGGDCLGL